MRADTLESRLSVKAEPERIVFSNVRKYTLLVLVSRKILHLLATMPNLAWLQLCWTQFIDVYNASAIVLATASVRPGIARSFQLKVLTVFL
jgi:hypothetical protein